MAGPLSWGWVACACYPEGEFPLCSPGVATLQLETEHPALDVSGRLGVPEEIPLEPPADELEGALWGCVRDEGEVQVQVTPSEPCAGDAAQKLGGTRQVVDQEPLA